MIVGEGGTGKSCITIRFLTGKFDTREFNPTLLDSYIKDVEIENISRTLQILDTSGQEQFENIKNQNVNESDGFIVVFSIDSKDSYESCFSMFNDIVKIRKTQVFPVVFVGNKIDLEDKRQLTKHDIECKMREHGFQYIETSAKNDINVSETFQMIIKIIDEHRNVLDLEKKKEKKKSKCIMI